MKNRKSLRFIVFFIVIFSSCKKELSDIINESEKATFIVYTYDEFGTPSGSGSGFFIDESGIGLTNCHVLEGAAKAVIVTYDSSKYEIERILSADSKKDLLKFKIKNTNQKTFSILKFSSSATKKGDRVYCISNPLGLESTLSEGIASAVRTDKLHGNIIQFSAPISPGSSGGAILNEKGNVIGIATFLARGGQNLNFGILLNQELINSLSEDDFSKANPKFSKQGKLVVLNLKSDNDPSMVLNAIEFGNDLTTLYMTYTNLHISDDQWGIWLALDKKDDGFKIKDLDNNRVYYIVSSTIGDNRKNLTNVSLATSHRFKIFFPQMDNKINKLEISEGDKKGEDKWSNINLNDFKNINNFDLDKFKNIYAFSMLKEGELNEAKNLFLDIISNDPENIEALNTLGVVNFASDNKKDAIYYFTKAIEANPTIDVSYANRSYVYKSQSKFNEAIEDISKAINLSPNQVDYLFVRSELYIEISDFDNAIKDLNSAAEHRSKEKEDDK